MITWAETAPYVHVLSAAERKVLALYLDGQDAKDIGAKLFVSHKTVGVHLFSIRAKLNKQGVRFARVLTTQPKRSLEEVVS